MRRHLNTLYITTEGAWLNKDGANVVISLENKELGRIPIHTIGGIVCFGRVLMSPQLMGFCAESDVCVSYLTDYGRFLARVEGPTRGNVLLRREQYRRTDDPDKCSEIVCNIIVGKTLNQRAVLKRTLRDHGNSLNEEETEKLQKVSERFTGIARKVETLTDVDTLRGFEGEAGQIYFGIFDHLIRAQKDLFTFTTRSRRPPRDSVNAVLSFVYTLLMHDVRSALESNGLDPAVGFLHRERPGRPSLALDLMEEFRPFLADRLTLSLINRQQLGEKDFRQMENGAVLLNEDGRKKVLVAYQERKRDELTHPFLNEKMSIGLLFHVQTQLFARHLRGDIDGYPPFIWK